MMQSDIIEKLGRSTIQHGKVNDRIYLMKADEADEALLPAALKEMAGRWGYSKVFAKVPADWIEAFGDEGYVCEARVPDLLDGRDAAMMGLFLQPWRAQSTSVDRNDAVMEACRLRSVDAAEATAPPGMSLRMCEPGDAEAMAALYARVFASYPFPITDPAYIRRTMASHVVYFGAWLGDAPAALSSAEVDVDAGCAEMTDFATDPAHRGRRLAGALLEAMAVEMRRRRIRTAYTIARATSFGMNIAFARAGYRFRGRLLNNTHIAGAFEDMNVWSKPLAGA